MVLQLSSKAGIFVTSSLPPGAQGATITGTQGIGVNTPIAAAVADATVGLPRLLHIPNVIGGFGISIMVATGRFEPITVFCDVTISVAGAAPNVH